MAIFHRRREDSSDQATLGCLRVSLPFWWTHQLVFSAGISRRADDLCDVFTSAVVQLLELRIDGGKNCPEPSPMIRT